MRHGLKIDGRHDMRVPLACKMTRNGRMGGQRVQIYMQRSPTWVRTLKLEDESEGELHNKLIANAFNPWPAWLIVDLIAPSCRQIWLGAGCESQP